MTTDISFAALRAQRSRVLFPRSARGQLRTPVPAGVLDELATCAAVRYELSGLTIETGPLAALQQITLRGLPTDDMDLPERPRSRPS
jgi:hypothetical protein